MQKKNVTVHLTHYRRMCNFRDRIKKRKILNFRFRAPFSPFNRSQQPMEKTMRRLDFSHIKIGAIHLGVFSC